MDAGVVMFIDVTLAGDPDPLRAAFNLSALWQRILAIQPPPQSPPVTPDTYNKTPTPYPGRVGTLKGFGYAGRVAIAAVAVVLVVAVPAAWWLWLLAGIVAFLFVKPAAAHDAEIARRHQVLNAAETKWKEFCARWPLGLDSKQFLQERAELEYKRKVYQGLRGQYETERRKLHYAGRERQLGRYLDRFSIDRAQLQDIGPGRRATLVSFGIESAADVTHARVSAVSGFGPILTSRLLAWRKELERGFTFDTSRAVDPADIVALNRKSAAERMALESALRAGPEVLSSMEVAARRTFESLRPEMEELAAALGQARADMKAK
jgi:DNA-binding helix-hairpin-helix protein with protein kinase domain